MTFAELLQNNYIFLDGGMGTMLQARGMQAGERPELLNLKDPALVEQVQRAYVEAGSNIICSNTFGANRAKLTGSGATVQQVIPAAIQCARRAAAGKALVALDLGPTGQMLEPTGSLTFEQAYDLYAEQVDAGQEADLILIETMTDLYEIRAAVLAAKEHGNGKPVIALMTFEHTGRTFTGCSVSAMALTLEGLGVDAMGINCSIGPDELYPVVEELCRWTTLPLLIKPNAGLPDPVTNQYNVSPAEFARSMTRIAKLGVKLLGGCCGTTPDYIRAVREAVADLPFTPRQVQVPAAVCSYSRTVIIDRPRVIGERINPTGKKLFKEALLRGDIDYILGQAITQVHGGADILDVNVGLPSIDERDMMVRTVKALQGVVDVPLQLDSTMPQVLEAALRIYNGKPIVNSVNGEEKSLSTVLPLVKKYGAAVVGLTLDEQGIPKTAEGRFQIAKRILDRALALGIRREDVYIDCLTLTVSAEQDGAVQTLSALHRVKQELGLKTVLGVSNISFGLPNRELVNHSFLLMALQNGLDLPIMNPNVASMMDAVRSYCLLANIDKNAVDFIAAYGSAEPKAKPAAAPADMTLSFAIENGLKQEGARITRQLLEQMDSMEIVNGQLIPALDKAGAAFEQGKLFLPQLIQAAGVAQAAFGEIRSYLTAHNAVPVSRGKVILATVKGDIHDIGKNIVKVLMENYGYQVIDLGRDVPPETIVAAALEHRVKLVGLSALMTTTLGAMEETIRQLHANNVPCKVVVGGAVLTADYAAQIGADYYAKDAKESVDIAKQVVG